jgi:hypothetical protein
MSTEGGDIGRGERLVGSQGWVVERFQVDYNGNIERSSREGGSVVHVAFALPWPWLSTHYLRLRLEPTGSGYTYILRRTLDMHE